MLQANVIIMIIRPRNPDTILFDMAAPNRISGVYKMLYIAKISSESVCRHLCATVLHLDGCLKSLHE